MDQDCVLCRMMPVAAMPPASSMLDIPFVRPYMTAALRALMSRCWDPDPAAWHPAKNVMAVNTPMACKALLPCEQATSESSARNDNLIVELVRQHQYISHICSHRMDQSTVFSPGHQRITE